MMDEAPHIPVLKDEVLKALNPQDSEIYIDGTLGAGGYTRAILDAANCSVIGIDQDPLAHEMAAKWMSSYPGRLHLAVGNFADMVTLINSSPLRGEVRRGASNGRSIESRPLPSPPPNGEGIKVDGIVLDIGVSSMQFDDAARGFSFSKDAPLDMRMSQEGMTAADFLNEADEKDIADVLYQYGEEHASRKIAKAIIAARPITRTTQLTDIIHGAIGNKGKTDSATKSFQALRIHVNGELDALKKGLAAAEKILAPNGRLIVVSFHSLEDRIVKNFIHNCASEPTQYRHLPEALNDNFKPSFKFGSPKKVKASDEEIALNPRARSAVMRVAIRTEHPPINPRRMAGSP